MVVLSPSAQGVGHIPSVFGPGDDKDSIPPVMGANGLRWYTIPESIIPALVKRPENLPHTSNKQRWNVFHDNDTGL